ncbi:unnamed protein product [Eruca vesicaria subsp. sativa]|uniref:Uncharacterized protein n=1 Tax=Eruca vesicaria subsp. sativa TaxID=29727 RepID=A0ABC8LZE4_ERUVS|nr:unnamed protein product [Eruca vesicaria subsp. sativa]
MERAGVFSRIHSPPLSPAPRAYEKRTYQHLRQDSRRADYDRRRRDHGSGTSKHSAVVAHRNGNGTSTGHRYTGHSDRIIRHHDDRYRSTQRGGARHVSGPFDRRREKQWRAKPNTITAIDGHQGLVTPCSNNGDMAPYGHVSSSATKVRGTNDGDEHGVPGIARVSDSMRLASKIVTPTADAATIHMESYVTMRSKGSARALTFSHEDVQEVNGDGQMIGALNDMESVEQQAEGMLEFEPEEDDFNDDDLLGEELMDSEGKSKKEKIARTGSRSSKSGQSSTRSRRHGVPSHAPLGIQNKKFELLRRGSPRGS